MANFEQGIQYLREKYGPALQVTMVQPGCASSMDEDRAFNYCKLLVIQRETQPMVKCSSCSLILANWKQYLMHVNQSCANAIPREESREFDAVMPRWKKDDLDRVSMGRRLFSRINPEERGRARPQTDFIEDINARLEREMVLGTAQGLRKTREFLQSEAAMKIKDRVEKHLREAQGMLVCNKCEVACKDHLHFLIHLTTYGHRLNVKGTSFELISLLFGWFEKRLYANKADPSEVDENIEPDDPNELLMYHAMGSTETWTNSAYMRENPDDFEELDEEEDYTHPPDFPVDSTNGQLKSSLLDGFSQRVICSCTACNAMYTNFKQFLMHIASEQHVQSVGKVVQSSKEAAEDERGHQEFLAIFNSDLQKWKWADRVALAGGKKIYKGWSENEKNEAGPKEEFIKELNAELAKTIKKKANGKYEEYFLVAERYFVSAQAKKLMNGLEKHLKESNKFVCDTCKFGGKDLNSFFIHCMTYEHVKNTQGSIYELPTILIGVQKKDLYA